MNKDWGWAEGLLEHQIDQYKRYINEVNCFKRLIDLYDLRSRYVQGERSDELYSAIESLE